MKVSLATGRSGDSYIVFNLGHGISAKYRISQVANLNGLIDEMCINSAKQSRSQDVSKAA